MNKLFLFAVGGTGERVVNSLVMLLASGLEIDSEIHPVFFDTDAKGKALDKAKTVIKHYIEIRNELKRFDYSNSFFKTEIHPYKEVVIDGQQVQDLKTLIEEQNLTPSGKDELKLLFSTENLKMPLDMGFIGNPNVGSVALNYLLEGQGFQNILGTINDEDRIFIVSSIFGGTGAAGFPLILNKLRQTKNIGDNKSRIIVGGTAVLPYFQFNRVQAPNIDPRIINYENNIDASTFTAKTRAALMYYDANVIGNGLSSLYYLGDDDCRSSYDKVLGGAHQDNPANYIEVLTAMSVIHFTKYAQPYNETTGTTFYEYALNLDDKIPHLNLNSIPDKDKDFKKHLVSFHMFKLIWEKFIKNYITMNAPWSKRSGFDMNLYETNDLSKTLNKFLVNYDEWKNGLSSISHARRFKFYKDDAEYDEKTVTSYFEPDISNKTRNILNGEYHVTDPHILHNMNGNYLTRKSGNDFLPRNESVVFALHCISQAVKKIIENSVTV